MLYLVKSGILMIIFAGMLGMAKADGILWPLWLMLAYVGVEALYLWKHEK